MFRGTTILAIGCVLGMVLAAGPAAATLTRSAATVNTDFSINDTNTSGSTTWKGWLIGGDVASPTGA